MKDEEPPPLSRVKRRLIQAAVEIEESDADRLVFMHTVLCQTSLPYRDARAREWERRQGCISLKVSAGAAMGYFQQGYKMRHRILEVSLFSTR